jgi:maleate cis-trans isomerase
MLLKRQNQRIGMLLPSSNTTQEYEFVKMLPERVALHCARLSLSRIDPDSTVKILAELDVEAKKLADADVDVVVLSATAPSTRMGKGYDLEVCARIEKASGKPATTAATAMLEAFDVLKIKRISLAAPWAEITNHQVENFVQAYGIDVVQQAALGYVQNSDVGLLPAHTAYDLGMQVNHPDADAIFLACGNWLTLDIVERLEQDTGKPVLTTNGCAWWGALRMLNFDRSMTGFGCLFSHHLSA